MELVSVEGSRVTVNMAWRDALRIADALRHSGPDRDWQLTEAMASAFEAAALAGYMQGASSAEALSLETMRDSDDRQRRLDALQTVA